MTDWFDRLRSFGHVAAYVVLGLCALGFFVGGVLEVKDAVDGQPVVWGTFTEERCEPESVVPAAVSVPG